jgi:hypothetical protein
MHVPAPFHVTTEAETHITRLLQRPPLGMEVALILAFGLEQRDARGTVEVEFSGEHFMVGYYSFGQVSQWPRFDLCGRSILISPDALERLRGQTLTLRAHDFSHEGAQRQTHEFLVAA